MIDLAKLEPVLGGYQTYFPKHWPHVEDFKWEAAQHFHDHWNIDAADFGEMFKEATAKVFSLLDTGYAYPRAMILNFAAADCEATRAMFRSLFDESTELSQRIIAFRLPPKKYAQNTTTAVGITTTRTPVPSASICGSGIRINIISTAIPLPVTSRMR